MKYVANTDVVLDIPKAGFAGLCTPEIIETVANIVREGATTAVVAEACGISRRTYFNWMAWGEEGKEPYAEFYRQVKLAKAQARAATEIAIRRLNPLVWLTRGPARFDEDAWSDAQKVELTGANGGPIQLLASTAAKVLSTTELEQLETMHNKILNAVPSEHEPA